MYAIEIVTLFAVLRVIVPVVALIWLGEWVRSREPRRIARM